MGDEKSRKEQQEEEANDPKNRLTADDRGIKWDRACTDILCCLIFMVFIVAMVGLSFFALTKGDPRRIVTPFDSVGNACGAEAPQCSTDNFAWPQNTPCPTNGQAVTITVGEVSAQKTAPAARDFSEYKYKFFPFQSADFFTAYCVKECPTATYSASKKEGTCQGPVGASVAVTSYAPAGAPTAASVETPLDATGLVKCQDLCFTGYFKYKAGATAEDPKVRYQVAGFSGSECRAYEFNEATSTCTLWKGAANTITASGVATSSCYIKESSPVEVDYMPHEAPGSNLLGVDTSMPLYSLFPTNQQFGMCIPTKEVGAELFNTIIAEVDKKTGAVKYLVELGEVWEVLLGMAVATIFISLLYIGLLKWITKPLLYTSMFIILVGFVLLGGWCWMKKDEYDPVLQENNHKAAMGGAIFAWVLAFLYLCFIVCCWKNISLGASILEAASDFVTSNIRVLWLPIVSYLFCVPFVCYWVVTAVYLYSIGEPEFEDMSFVANIKWTDQTRYMIWFFVFGLCWSIAFIICVQQFMIAATVCQWYWTGEGGEDADMPDSPYSTSVCRSFKWGMWYHCGSIAFGSFLIALVTFIRIVFEYIVYQYEKVGNKENPVYKCLKCYIRYALYMLDKYVKFITKAAFIQICLSNKNFCSSAWTAFCLMLRNAGRFSAAGITEWIMMILGKGTIMGASCYLTFLIIKETNPNIQQPLVPAAVILMVSYLVGSMFLSVFSFAATAILHCFILDEDTRGGGNPGLTPKSLQPFLEQLDIKNAKDGVDDGSRIKKIEDKANDMN